MSAIERTIRSELRRENYCRVEQLGTEVEPWAAEAWFRDRRNDRDEVVLFEEPRWRRIDQFMLVDVQEVNPTDVSSLDLDVVNANREFFAQEALGMS